MHRDYRGPSSPSHGLANRTGNCFGHRICWLVLCAIDWHLIDGGLHTVKRQVLELLPYVLYNFFSIPQGLTTPVSRNLISSSRIRMGGVSELSGTRFWY